MLGRCQWPPPANPGFGQVVLSSGFPASQEGFPLTGSGIIYNIHQQHPQEGFSEQKVTSKLPQRARELARDGEGTRLSPRESSSAFCAFIKLPGIKREGIREEARLIVGSKCIFTALLNYHI